MKFFIMCIYYTLIFDIIFDIMSETFVTLIVGDIGAIESLADIYSETLRERVEEGVNEGGLVRIETDPDTTSESGRGIVAVRIHERNSGDHFSMSTVGSGLIYSLEATNNSIRIETKPFMRTPFTMGDIFAKHFLVVCTLDTIQNVRDIWAGDNFAFINLDCMSEKRYIVSVGANGVNIKRMDT